MSEETTVGRIGCASAVRPDNDIELRRLRADRFLRGKDVLDVGTGTGRLTWIIAAIAQSVVGVDPDAEAIRDARREARSRGLRNVRFVHGPAQELDVPDEHFDTAIFSWSL